MREKYVVREREEGASNFVMGIRYDRVTRLVRIGGPRRFIGSMTHVLNDCFSVDVVPDEYVTGKKSRRVAFDARVGPSVWRKGVELLKRRFGVTRVKRFGRLMF